MKKVLLIASVAILALASCKKDHTCTCGEGDSQYKTTINGSKSKAAAYCEGKGVEVSDEEGNTFPVGEGCTLD